MDKVRENGKVAVLISTGFGAGWYTWIQDETVLFDPEIVEMVREGKSPKEIEEVAAKKWPSAYLGGVDGLVIEWIPEGAQFEVDEYDGAESLHIIGDRTYITT